MKKNLGRISLLAVLMITPALQAQDHHDDQSHRYYDSKHKDYHTWSSDDDQKYHQYLKDNHKPDHDWKKANKRDQQAYFDYAHSHGDSH